MLRSGLHTSAKMVQIGGVRSLHNMSCCRYIQCSSPLWVLYCIMRGLHSTCPPAMEYSLTKPLGWNKSLMFLKSDVTIAGSDRPPALAAYVRPATIAVAAKTATVHLQQAFNMSPEGASDVTQYTGHTR